MRSNRTMHPKSETILVASEDAALVTSGALYTNNVANVPNGRLGIVSADFGQTVAYNNFIAGGATVATAPKIKIVQGTPYSADTTQVGHYGLTHKAVVESPIIDGRNRVTVSAQVAKQPTNDTWVLGNVTGNAGAFNLASNSTYTMNIGFASSKQDRFFSVTGLEIYSPQFVTPDYTALGITVAANQLDHFVQNFVQKINLNSAAFSINGSEAYQGNRQVVAFAINIGAGSGTALSGFTTGASIDVMTVNGVTYPITVTADMAASMTAAIAGSVLTTTSTIEVVDLTTAGTAANTDVIVLMALDHPRAFLKDRSKTLKPRLIVGLDDTFNGQTITKVNGAKAYEGHGQGWKWQIQYEGRAAMEHWSAQNHPLNNDFFIEAPTYITSTGVYTSYVIESLQDDYIQNYSHQNYRPHRTVILVPATYASGTTNTTFRTSLNAVLGVWLQSVATAGRLESALGTGAAPNYFT